MGGWMSPLSTSREIIHSPAAAITVSYGCGQRLDLP